MGVFEDLNTGKYNLILIIVLFVLAFHQYFFKSTKESMADVSDAQIADAVKKYYLADVEAVRKLSDVATKLQAGGLTLPSDLKVSGNLKAKGAILFDGEIPHPDTGDGALYKAEGQFTIAADDWLMFRSSSTKQSKIVMNLNDGHIKAKDMLIDQQISIGTNAEIKGSLKIGSWTIREADHGHLIFLKDGTKYDHSYSNIPENTGFLAMAGDGNFWSNRSTSRGWLPDNISTLSSRVK